MRIYGSSPLYNYVELLFRCKRMFIVAIILGTVVTSIAAARQSAKYEAQVVIALTGDRSATTTVQDKDGKEGVSRKALRLAEMWLPVDPSFLTEVIQNAGLDKRYKHKSMEKLVREVRQAITVDPGLINGQYLRLSMTWRDPEEAEAVLGQVYSVFARRTVDTETALQTTKLAYLSEQLKKYEAEANDKARAKQKFLQDHFYEQPELTPSVMNQNSAGEQQLSDLEMSRMDASSRLAQILQRLKTTPPRIVSSETRKTYTDRPELALMDQKKELEGELAQLKMRYTDIAPAVVELRKKIAALDQQIADARKAPHAERDEGATKTTDLNQEYVELRKLQYAYQMSITSADRQIAKLKATLAKNDAHLRAMPQRDVEFQAIQREFALADNLRNQIRNQYYALKVEAERDKLTEGLLVKQEIPPKAEPVNESAKSVLLYLAGPLLGIILAFCFSLLAEMMDHSLRTPVDVERHLGKPVLAVIPRVSATSEVRGQIGGQVNPSITS